MLLEDALHAADGVALAVQETADALEQIDVVRTIIAAAAAALHRLDLREAGLPETQHMLGNVEFVRDFTDGTERIGRLVQMPAPFRSLCEALVVLGVAVGDSVAVDTLFQYRRRLEHHHTARRNRYFGAGLRIASDALSLLAHHEGTERRQLH